MSKDGRGLVNCCGRTDENGTGGGINEIKSLTTADTIPCGASYDIDKPGAEADMATGQRLGGK